MAKITMFNENIHLVVILFNFNLYCSKNNIFLKKNINLLKILISIDAIFIIYVL